MDPTTAQRIRDLELENKQLQLRLDALQPVLDAIDALRTPPSTADSNDTNNIDDAGTETTEDAEDARVVEESQSTSRVGRRGQRVQQYDPSTLELIRTFKNATEVERELNGLTYDLLNKAIKNRIVYKGFRWFKLAHGDTDEKKDIGATVLSHTRNTGYVAYLNTDKTAVTQVFSNAKQASEVLQVTANAISRSVKNGTVCKDGIFQPWNLVEKSLKDAWSARNELPPMTSANGSRKLLQINPGNGVIVRTWASIHDALRNVGMSNDVLVKAIQEGSIYKDYRWKLADDA